MKYDDKQIIELIENGVSYEKIGRVYGVTGSAIKRYAKKIGVELPCRRKKNEKETFNKGISIKGVKHCLNCGKEMPNSSQNKFCSQNCFQEYRFMEQVSNWKSNPEKYEKEDLPSFIRRYMFEKSGNKCEQCGWGTVNEYTGTIPLEIHHIDGDCTNNKEENLQVLCPNCHSLTSNNGSLNKGKSKRFSLKQYKKNLKQRDTESVPCIST